MEGGKKAENQRKGRLPVWKAIVKKKKTAKSLKAQGVEKNVLADKRVCLRCRSPKHLFEDCPLNNEESTGLQILENSTASEVGVASAESTSPKMEVKRGNTDEHSQSEGTSSNGVLGFCYNCGKNTHKLKDCPISRAAEGRLPFASCFICAEKGHIASHCPKNPSGIYPRGGACRFCGSKYHLVKDCTEKTQRRENNTENLVDDKVAASNQNNGGDDGDEMWLNAIKPATQQKKRRSDAGTAENRGPARKKHKKY